MSGFWLADMMGAAEGLDLPTRPRAPAWREQDRDPAGGEEKRAKHLGRDPEWLAWANGPAPVGTSLDRSRPPMLDVSGLREPFPWWGAFYLLWFLDEHRDPEGAPTMDVRRVAPFAETWSKRPRVRFWPKECAIDMRSACPCAVCLRSPRRLGHDPVLFGATGYLVDWPDPAWKAAYEPLGHPYCVKLVPPVEASWPEGMIGAWTHAPASATELELLDEHGNTTFPP